MLLARLRQSVAGLATAARRNPRPLAALQTYASYPLRKYASAEKIRHREGTYSLTTLPSGLRIATEDTGHETLTIGLWIDTGSRYESAETNGVAHFLEHMAFKGTTSRTQADLEIEIENMGGHLNAYTSREMTVYYAKCLKRDTEHALEILADILQNSLLPKRQIESERSVILREMEEVESQMEEVVYDRLHETAYGNSPLARTILGPVENIRSISQDQLRQYIRDNYIAPRIALVAAGGIDHDYLVDLAERKLNGFPAHGPAVSHDKPVFQSADYRMVDNTKPLAHIGVAFEGSSWASPHYFPMMIASTIIGQWNRSFGAGANISSPLAQEVGTNNLAHSYMAFCTCYADTGLWGMYLTAEAGRLPELMQAVNREFVRLCDGITDEEVERAKIKFKTQALMQLDGTTAVCEEIGRQLLCLGRRLDAQETEARIEAVDAAAVRAVMREHIYGKTPALVSLGPVETMPMAQELRVASM